MIRAARSGGHGPPSTGHPYINYNTGIYYNKFSSGRAGLVHSLAPAHNALLPIGIVNCYGLTKVDAFGQTFQRRVVKVGGRGVRTGQVQLVRLEVAG